MTERLEEPAERPPAEEQEDLSQYLPKKHALGPAIVATSLLLRRTKTYFEEGAREEIAEHTEAGGTLLTLVTHFRRMETIAIAHIAWRNKVLNHLIYNTGITGRREMAELPVAGYFVRNSGLVTVERSSEHPNETPEEKAARQQENLEKQAIGGWFLANGHDWLVFPEGTSKVPVMKDGEPVIDEDGKMLREQRDPYTVLPAQLGFVYTLQAMTPEERSKVKMLGMSAHYGESSGLLSRLTSGTHPTIAIPRLVTPLEGDYEDKAHMELVRQQGENLLRRGKEDAIRLHAERGY